MHNYLIKEYICFQHTGEQEVVESGKFEGGKRSSPTSYITSWKGVDLIIMMIDTIIFEGVMEMEVAVMKEEVEEFPLRKIKNK